MSDPTEEARRVADADLIERAARAISDANWQSSCTPEFLDQRFNDELLHPLFVKQARAVGLLEDRGDGAKLSEVQADNAKLVAALEGARHDIVAVINGYNSRMVKWLLRGRRDEIDAVLAAHNKGTGNADSD